jgi:hypothetical protein
MARAGTPIRWIPISASRPYWGTTPLPYGIRSSRRWSSDATACSRTCLHQSVTYGSWQIGWNLNFIGQAYYAAQLRRPTPPPPPPPQDIPYMVTLQRQPESRRSPHLVSQSDPDVPHPVRLSSDCASTCRPTPSTTLLYEPAAGMTGLQYFGAPTLYAYTPTGGHEPSNEWDWGTPCSAGGMSRQCTQPGWGGPWNNGGFRNWDGNQITSSGIYRETYSTSFGYFNPWAPPDPNGEPGIFNRHYMHFDSDYTAYQRRRWQVDQWRRARPAGSARPYRLSSRSMLPQKPTNWPDCHPPPLDGW